MTSPIDPELVWDAGTDHRQARVVLDDHEVHIDEPLVPLIESLHRCGITTNHSCQEVRSAHGDWRDEPDRPRFYVVFPDVEELRKLLPILARSDELSHSIRPCLGSPRWEYGLSIHGGAGEWAPIDGDLRIQVAVFVPVDQLDTLVTTLGEWMHNTTDLSVIREGPSRPPTISTSLERP